MKAKLQAVFFGFLVFSRVSDISAQAQSELTPELKSAVNAQIEQAVNGITVFTSQSSVSSGEFVQDNPDEPHTDISISRIPFSFDIAAGESVIPFVDGNVGVFRVVERIPPAQGEGANDFSRLETWSAALGGGVKIKASDEITVTPAASVSYSHTKNYYDYNNEFSQTILQPYGKELFGWYVDTMTYTPSLKVQYDHLSGVTGVKIWSKYSQLFNDSISTDSSTIDVSSDTGLWQNSITFNLPIKAKINERPVAWRAGITRTDVYGSGRQGLEFGHFYDASLDFVVDTKNSLDPFKELSIGAAYTFAEDLTGWRVSVGYAF